MNKIFRFWCFLCNLQSKSRGQNTKWTLLTASGQATCTASFHGLRDGLNWTKLCWTSYIQSAKQKWGLSSTIISPIRTVCDVMLFPHNLQILEIYLTIKLCLGKPSKSFAFTFHHVLHNLSCDKLILTQLT